MLDFQHNNHCLNLMVQNCKTVEQYTLLVQHLNELNNRLDQEGLVDVYEAYMSVDRYYTISKLILNKEDIIVVDCGCGHGLQQLFFQDCKRYIGIDVTTFPIMLTDNCTFIKGNVKDVIPRLKEEGRLDGEVICISVLAGMCFPEIRDTMYQFDRVINI